MDKEKLRQAELRDGYYLLRSNRTGGDPSVLWSRYVQLTQIEAVFRSLKSDRGIRPVYHQLEHRVDAHILIAFLAYCLQVTLKNQLLIHAPGRVDACGRSGETGDASKDRCPRPDRRWTMADSPPIHPPGSGAQDDPRPAQTQVARPSTPAYHRRRDFPSPRQCSRLTPICGEDLARALTDSSALNGTVDLELRKSGYGTQ